MTAMTLKMMSKDISRKSDSKLSGSCKSGNNLSTKKSKARSTSGKCATKQEKAKNSLNNLRKMQDIARAENFYRKVLTRKHFCIWIEKYI